MRRVLVPLDGTDLAAAILPDAQRLAGPGGELVLIRDATTPSAGDAGQRKEIDALQAYLDAVVQTLRAEGVSATGQPVAWGDAAMAIDRAAELLDVDMTAVATHGRSASEQWQRGSVAWRTLLRSRVPVLVRHVPEADGAARVLPEDRQILVPLDGSALAEKALPLARALADEWDAPLRLAQAVPAEGDGSGTGADEAERYLQRLRGGLGRNVQVTVVTGPAEESLVVAVDELGVTDVVMTSQGRTGVSRANVGSVADALIHGLTCPIVIIPPLVTLSEGQSEAVEEGANDG